MIVETKYEPRDEVWYFRNSVPTKTEVKSIHIKIEKLPRTKIIIKYELLREKTQIHEKDLFPSQIDLYGSLENETH